MLFTNHILLIYTLFQYSLLSQFKNSRIFRILKNLEKFVEIYKILNF